MKTPCVDCLGWEEDHENGVCPGPPGSVEALIEREVRRRNPVAHKLGEFAVKCFPWLKGSDR